MVVSEGDREGLLRVLRGYCPEPGIGPARALRDLIGAIGEGKDLGATEVLDLEVIIRICLETAVGGRSVLPAGQSAPLVNVLDDIEGCRHYEE